MLVSAIDMQRQALAYLADLTRNNVTESEAYLDAFTKASKRCSVIRSVLDEMPLTDDQKTRIAKSVIGAFLFSPVEPNGPEPSLPVSVP